MKRIRMSSKTTALLAAFSATLLGLPVGAATFPNYPLQTGTGSVPPNILFILDDSGSMNFPHMPIDIDDGALEDTPAHRSYLHNTLYYNPNTDYKPWLQANGTRMTGGTSIDAVYSHASLASGSRDLRDHIDSVFYLPKDASVTSQNFTDFYRYWVRSNGGSAEIVRLSASGTLVDIPPVSTWTRNIDEDAWVYRTIQVPEYVTELRIEISGNTNSNGWGNADLYLRRGTSNPTTSTYDARDTGSGSTETIVVNNPAAGAWRIGIFNSDSGGGDRRVLNNVLTVRMKGRVETANPSNRALTDELRNIATWYSYHRTRMKAAKAGASETFAGLGKNFRVGFDTIWNRGTGHTPNTGGSAPSFPIPVSQGGGLFEDDAANGIQNKTNWFTRLFNASGSGGTPLRGALQRAGRYYESSADDGPWGPANQLACRQSYAILTTDGYWNNASGFVSGVVNNADGTDGEEIVHADGKRKYKYVASAPYKDGWSDTVADIAMYYWKRDLRPDLANKVPTSQNPAFWQHMSTFGISIGQSGQTGYGSVSAVPSNFASWQQPFDGRTAKNIDDLLHAGVISWGSFVAGRDPEAFANALKSSLAVIESRLASGSNVAANGPKIEAGSLAFQAVYTSGSWNGDVRAYSLASGSQAGTPTWSAADRANTNAANFLARGVYPWDGNDGVTFPTSTQKTKLARTGGIAPVTADDNVAYLKGDRTLESNRGNGGKLRSRVSPIGDIVNSSPFYVRENQYLFVGANDGMLHAIEGSSGDVKFSYVPAGIDFTRLASLSDPDYDHRFFVDGGIDVSTKAQGNGRNILAATLGRGGRGVFALDVTNPGSFSDANVLWDRTGSAADADMGYVLGAPLVRKGNNGKTLVMVGNGAESPNGKAVLYIYVLNSDGSVPNNGVITLVADAGSGNGLAEPRAADIDNDGDADYVYAGDLQGNVWKFDLTSSNANQWKVAFSGNPLFVAKDANGTRQPITAPVALAREPVTNRLFVFVGTGRYIYDSDITSTSTQTLYALIDTGAAISGRSDLQERSIAEVGTDSKGRDARAFESYEALPDGKKGWYLDLGNPKPGERIVTAPFLRGRALWFSTIIPQTGSGCDAGGTGYLNAIDAFTGTLPSGEDGTWTYFDVDGNNKGDDRVTPGGGGSGGYVGSVDLGVGMPSQGVGVGNKIIACGSDAECGETGTPPGGGAPRRLGWRELFRRD